MTDFSLRDANLGMAACLAWIYGVINAAVGAGALMDGSFAAGGLMVVMGFHIALGGGLVALRRRLAARMRGVLTWFALIGACEVGLTIAYIAYAWRTA